MNHQTHVRLVDAHAKGIGSDDGPQFPTYEALLDVLFSVRRQTCMEAARLDSLCLQELRDLLRLSPCRAVDDCAARLVFREIGRQNLVDMSELLSAARLHHHKFQVGTSRPAVKDLKADIKLLLKVVHDFGHHIGLGGRRQTQHGRHRVLSRPLTDEAPDVTVVGPEVVPPLRKAVGLVQNPGSYLTLSQDTTHGDRCEAAPAR